MGGEGSDSAGGALRLELRNLSLDLFDLYQPNYTSCCSFLSMPSFLFLLPAAGLFLDVAFLSLGLSVGNGVKVVCEGVLGSGVLFSLRASEWLLSDLLFDLFLLSIITEYFK